MWVMTRENTIDQMHLYLTISKEKKNILQWFNNLSRLTRIKHWRKSMLIKTEKVILIHFPKVFGCGRCI